MTDKHITFNIDYDKLKIFDEYNTEDFIYPIVLSSPHSGRMFPPEFLANTCLSESELRLSEDCFVDELARPASNAGIPLIAMNISRAFIDVNRDKIEIDDSMFFDKTMPENAIGSRRCRVGLGVIPRIVAQNKPIYDGLLSYAEICDRIKFVYDAYHKRLKQLITKCYKKFGFCLVIDCHSMPSKICNIMNENQPIDFCVGNLFDESCPNDISQFFAQQLAKDNRYRVEFNKPYSGAFITFNYCQPRKKIFALQLEVNRSLYVDEISYQKKTDFQTVSTTISGSIVQLGKFLLDFNK